MTMDKLESMRAFTHVVNYGSFAAAARHMGMSRSAVNKMVINLESSLGVQLLHRSTRKVTITETGKGFYERCLNILSDVEEAELAVSSLNEEPRGKFKLNAPMSFGKLYLAGAIADFMLKYPELQVQLTLDDRFVDPIDEGYDLVVRIAETVESASLIVHKLTTIKRFLCASSSYLKTFGSPKNPQELEQHSCLHYGDLTSGNHWKLRDKNGEYLVNIKGVLCSNNGEVLAQAVRKGLGIALLPNFIISQDLQAGKLKVILPEYEATELTLSIIYPVNRHLSTKVKLFTEFLKNRVNNVL
jgi:DNA-binding transcriptional LysR family regulator